MFGSSILDIAIGLVFVYLLLSLLVTASSELIASWLKRRQDCLRRGMMNLLGEAWAGKLYDHPLIKGLTPPALLKWADVAGVKPFFQRLLALLDFEAGGPSYIPPRTFVLSLLDTIGFKLGSGLQNDLRRALDNFPDTIVDARTFKNALLAAANTAMAGSADAVREFQGFLLTIPDTSSFAAAQAQLQKFLEANPGRFGRLGQVVAAFAANVAGSALTAGEVKAVLMGVVGSPPASDELQTLLSYIPDSASAALVKQEALKFLDRVPLEDPLHSLPAALQGTELAKSLQLYWDEAGHDLEKFKVKLETWFNDAMDRVSGWYKRESQLVNVVLAVILTVGVNVDTILIVDSLAKSSALRDSLVAQATKFVEQPPASLQPLLASTPETNAPGASGGLTAANEVFSLILSPNTVPGGEDLKGIVTLRQTNTTDLAFKLTSSPTNLATVPASVTVPAGQTTAEFAIHTRSMANSARVDISASNRVVVLQLLPSLQEQFRAARAELENLNLPIGWVLETNTPPDQKSKPPVQTNQRPAQTNKAVVSATGSNAPGSTVASETSTTNLVFAPPPSSAFPDRNHQLFLVVPNTKALFGSTIAFHLLGWVLTAIAVSIGAPFWFDLLNKFITIRSSGGVPAPKPTPPQDALRPSETVRGPR
jgi:hypothetical protein